MNKAHRRGNVVRVTALTAALLGVYGPAFADGGTALTVDSGNSPATLDSGTTYTNVVILDGGTATGTNSTITGSEYELAQVNPGGSLTLTGATITNTVTPNQNGRAVSVDGAGGQATLNNATITLTANDGWSGGHAFTAGVGVQNGGHADIDGGTIIATGSKRTVGIQANDGGSIDAKNVAITTDSTFGHAVNAYTDPAGDGPATVVTLDHVTVNTGNVTYADGIQSANKGASVVATDTDITTLGTASFGAEVFNGATVSLTGGSITTSGANAAGVRAYAGDGNTLLGEATVDGTTITTSGKNAIGVMAGDLDGSSGTAGIVTLSQATINTSGQGATGIQANYGGTITSTGSTITTTGSGAHAAAALNGSSIALDGDKLKATGTGYGLYVTGAGSTVTATNGTTIETDNGKYAVEAADGGQVSLSGGSVTNAGTVGDRTSIYATGDGTSVTTHDVAISNSAPGLGTGDLSNVVSAANNATVELNGGSVTSEGSTFGRGLLASSGATITANNVDISTAGTLSNAVHAFSADEGATGHNTADSAFINLDGGTVSTTGANSYGLSAQNSGAAITATDTTGKTSITTTGANSFGASAYNGGALDLTGVTIDTKGTGADGIAVNETLGAQSPSRVPTPNVGSTLTLKDSSVTSEKANGIYVGKDSTATIENTDISAAKRGVIVQDGGSATLTGGSVASTGNEQYAVMVDGADSSFSATNVAISAAGSIDNRGDVTHAIDLTNNATATITGGTIKTTGANFTTGIFAQKSSKATAENVDISTTGDTGIGLRAYSYDKVAGDAVDTPSITVTGGSISTAGTESYGAWSQNIGAEISLDGTTIQTQGANAYGVVAFNQGNLDLTDVDISTQGDGAYGASLNTMGDGYRPGETPANGATLTMAGGSITTQGNNAAGVLSTAGSTANLTGTSITTNGLYSYGAYANSGGTIRLDGGSVTTNNAKGKGTQDGDGSRAYALYADGTGSSVTTTNGTTILTQGQRAYGAYATNGANVTMNGGSITTNGFMAYGLYSSGAGSTVDASNVNVTTTGDVGDAVWAYQGGVTTLNGGTITVGGDPNVNPPGETANGLVAVGGDGGAIADGTINATGITLVTKGTDSVGALAGAQVGTSYTSGTINLNNSSITVQGANSVAAEVDYGSTLNASNGTKLVSQQGDGIVMTGNSTVNLTGTTVEAAGASLVSNLDGAGQEQNITIGSGSTLTKNDGRLLQVNRTDDGMDGVVNLTLADGSISHGDIVDLDGLDSDGVRTDGGSTDLGGKTNFTVGAGATWSGVVRGINDTTVEDGASATNDAPTTVTGNVATGTNTTVTYNDSATIGGGVSTGSGSTAVFNGTTEIGSTSGSTDGSGNVNGTNSSLTFNGATTIHNTVSGTGSNLTFNGNTSIGNGISGSDGTHFVFSKTGTTVITGNVTLDSGSTTHGGTVDNLITVTGNANVTNGATLGGDLNIQGALNLDGGTIGPGNSVGTITATSLSGAGLNGTYHAEVNSAGKSDLIHITTGLVDLSSTKLEVAQENGNGGYVLNHDYTILQADGGLVASTAFQSAGLDSSLAGSLVKLDPIMYDDGTGTVKISLSLDNTKASAFDGTSNQNATLGGVMSVAGKNTAADAALSSTDTTGSLDQLSGESHASTQSVLLASGGLVQNTLFDRLRGNLGAGMLPGEPVAQASGPLPASAMPRSAALPLWFQVVGNWSTLGGTSNTAPVSTSTGGVFLGGDTPVGDGWRVGGAFGYTNSNIDVDDRSSGANVNSYTAALYGGKSAPMGNGRLKFMAGVGVTRNNVDSRRTVTLGGSQTLKAFYHADSAQVFSELGYAMPLGADMEIEPYAGVAFQSLHTQGFDESGGDAALSVNGETDNVTTTTLGLRGKKRFDLGAARQAVLSAGLGWRHAMGDITPTSQMAFVTGGGTSFNVEGAPVAQDAAVVDVSGEMVVGRDAAVGLRYNGQFGSGSHDNSGTLYLKVRFK